LTKPEVNFLILIATFAGFYLAPTPAAAGFQTSRVICTLVGTLFVASGTAALNQFLERSFDAQMRRTARRPVASGRVAPLHALCFGIVVSLAGASFLAATVNVLTSSLSVATLLSYLFVYTPLKRKTPLCTFTGAFPGAVPPLIGWAAARGRLDWGAWILFVLVFLWQFPHFIAIAWMYREDYARAGYNVLPAGRWRGRVVTWQSAAVSLLLIAVSLIPAVAFQSSLGYSVAAVPLGLIFFYYSSRFAYEKSNASARRLLVASIIYLPLMLGLIMLNKQWREPAAPARRVPHSIRAALGTPFSQLANARCRSKRPKNYQLEQVLERGTVTREVACCSNAKCRAFVCGSRGFFRRTVGQCQSFGYSLLIQAGFGNNTGSPYPRLLCRIREIRESIERFVTNGLVHSRGSCDVAVTRSGEDDAIGKITLSILAVKPDGWVYI
jgi:protoheme IX farnesyltransferase